MTITPEKLYEITDTKLETIGLLREILYDRNIEDNHLKRYRHVSACLQSYHRQLDDIVVQMVISDIGGELYKLTAGKATKEQYAAIHAHVERGEEIPDTLNYSYRKLKDMFRESIEHYISQFAIGQIVHRWMMTQAVSKEPNPIKEFMLSYVRHSADCARQMVELIATDPDMEAHLQRDYTRCMDELRQLAAYDGEPLTQELIERAQRIVLDFAYSADLPTSDAPIAKALTAAYNSIDDKAIEDFKAGYGQNFSPETGGDVLDILLDFAKPGLDFIMCENDRSADLQERLRQADLRLFDRHYVARAEVQTMLQDACDGWLPTMNIKIVQERSTALKAMLTRARETRPGTDEFPGRT